MQGQKQMEGRFHKVKGKLREIAGKLSEVFGVNCQKGNN
jgi:uncharacterized protein YjbJ (UPF0337 family)